VNGRGEVIGDLDIDSVYAWDKPAYLKSVYGTERTDHPGADMALKGDADKTHLVGGTHPRPPAAEEPEVRQVHSDATRGAEAPRHEELEARRRIPDRNPLHRAHEYALVYGLETLVRQGHDAGAC
jgi:sulfate adenylyltransferase